MMRWMALAGLWGCAERAQQPTHQQPPDTQPPPLEQDTAEPATESPPPDVTGVWAGMCDFSVVDYGQLDLRLKLDDADGYITGAGRLQVEDDEIPYDVYGQRTDSVLTLELHSLYSTLMVLGAEVHEDELVGEMTVYPTYLGGETLLLPCALSR